MEKVKMGARHTAPIVAVFEKRFEETFNRLAKNGRTLHSRCSTTTWLRSSRSSSKVNGLQTTMVTCPALLQRCWTPFQLRGIISVIMPKVHGCTAVLSDVEATRNFAWIQGDFTAHGNHVVRYSCHDCGLAPGVTSVSSRN